MTNFHPPGDCPCCGEEVPRGAVSCPSCGASESDGWSDRTWADGLDLPEERDAEEPESSPRQHRPSAAFNVLVVTILILILSGAWFLFPRGP